MVFLFLSIIFLVIILLLFSKIKIEVGNFKFISTMPKHINKDYIITFKLCILGKIPIVKVKITDERIRKLKLKEKIENIDIKKLEKDINLKKLHEISRKSKFTIKRFNLKMEIGTENASVTAIVIPIISTLISFVLKNRIKDYKSQIFNIKPLFLNKNMLNIKFSGIFEIKMIHIINIIYILNKKEGVKDYERTSNRRPYAYSYE